MTSKDPARGGSVNVQDVIAIQNSISHTVILKRNGTVWAWGQNSIGELGNGTFEQSTVPAQVKNLDNIVQISTNYHFNLALDKGGSVWFWGFTTRRDENNNPIGVNSPEKVNGLNDVVNIHAGGESMVIRSDGTYWSFNVDDRTPQKIDTLQLL
jgi:alpha-tubulin suppressor-like RCC1 family protein